MSKHTTRETWLVAAVEAMRPLFATVDAEIPAVRVSVGWPGGRGDKNRTIGQCWNSHAAADSVCQLFISPVLDDAPTVLATLAHELVHAVDDCKSGHRGEFARMAKGIGLTGKMTATVASDELREKLAKIESKLGDYPHARLTTMRRVAGRPEDPSNPESPEGEPKAGEPKQTTRMIKTSCPDSGYIARTTRKWLEEFGAPLCPCHSRAMEVAS